ncbi:MAG: antibiotic biosynthesis monooxygenase, partial [Mucispirillum sp.]|nr:antibiotic biosynthesis monooxygenase [Mucispirillum sp.]
MIKITARHTVKENCIEELVKILKELVEKSRQEEGCISYSLYKDIEQDNIYT